MGLGNMAYSAVTQPLPRPLSRIHTGGGRAVGGLKRFMRVWRVLHVLLAVVMMLTIVAHVGVAWLLGYRWVLP